MPGFAARRAVLRPNEVGAAMPTGTSADALTRRCFNGSRRMPFRVRRECRSATTALRRLLAKIGTFAGTWPQVGPPTEVS
jgi:hypothetical protein